jgi:hypothetical protein
MVVTLLILGLLAMTAEVATGQTPDTECQVGRERLAGHARASEAVRKLVAARAGTTATGPTGAGAPGPPPPGGRAAEIRTRLAEIPRERQRLDDVRVAAMVKLDFARAAQAQGQLETLEQEKRRLERELATMPQSPSAQALLSPTPPASSADADRVPCRDVTATLEAAVKARRRELGARETQPGAVPLTPLRGQTADAIARELAAQFAPWPEAAAQVGLLDQDGRGRVDGLVDVPAKDVFRVTRLRADGALGVDVFTSALAPGYGEAARRLDEAALRRAGWRLEEMLVRRPAGPIRIVSETGDARRLLAGECAEAARTESMARAIEFENLRGETVRVLELVTPTPGGLDWRRVVVVAPPNAAEQWDETTLRLKPASSGRTDAELTIARETRAAGVAVAASRDLQRLAELFGRRSILPRQRDVIVPQQAIVRQAADRREVTMRDVAGTLEAADVVGHRTQRQVYADPVPRREVRGRGVHQAAVEEDHGSRGALGRDDAATVDELLDRRVVDDPERIARRGDVVLGVEHTEGVAAGNEHQRAVELVDVVEEDRDVHGAGLGHLVVRPPRAVVLVPLPDVAVERGLAVDLELVHVDVFPEDLPHRLHHARVPRELGEGIAVHVRGEVGAHDVARLLADVLGPPLRVQGRHLVGEDADLVLREQAREEEEARAVELVELLLGESHDAASVPGV